ncbi:ubiquitin-protein ligase [Mycena galopus ATCC 62051]|nr:ubiquitin-protein ligase [Mycena galopus ATCC 62051]
MLETFLGILGHECVLRLVYRLVEWYRAWAPIDELGPTIRAAYTLTFHTQLFSFLPPGFVRGFKALCASTLVTVAQHTQQMWESFEVLGLTDRYEGIIASVGYERIEDYVRETCTGKWDKPCLEDLRRWMSEQIVPWMLPMYAKGAANTEDARGMLQNVGSRFDFHMNKTLCDLRTSEIFEIIIDFPDSNGALQDLKECLQRVDQRASLVQALRKANRKRLLHPGADTKLILSQYVATIRCLRIVDPPGVLLFKVADPIRRYLRERPDTIRSIVANLVGDDDSGDSLVDENEPIQPLQQLETEDYSDPHWDPEPIDAGPDFRTNKPSDVISTLVSIYDSKDLFVKELQVLLAQRLLAITDDNFDKVEKERRNIEILKIRFGEAALQSQKASIVHPTIISRHFWPSLESSDIVMPGQFQALQTQYAKEFSTFKPDKKLRWLPHLGTVHLELQLEDRAIETDVPPLEAAFIELFSEKSKYMDDGRVNRGRRRRGSNRCLKALITWIDLGVLKEDEENTFRLLEVAEEAAPAARTGKDASLMAPTVIEAPTVTAAQQQQADQMRLYWKFIEGMLTNLGSLPLDRIQTMLRFAPGYDQTIEQLAGFMEAARREGLVVGRDGMWKLNR